MSQQTTKYHINVFWSDEDECWIADVPDLQFCSAHGDSPDDATREIQIAMQLWLESWMDNHDAPPPAKYHPAPAATAAAA